VLARVRQLGPLRLVVRFDRRRIFRERQFEPNERVHVAVGYVMHDLSDGPAVGTIRRVELRVGKSANGGAPARGRRDDGVDRATPVANCEAGVRAVRLRGSIRRTLGARRGCRASVPRSLSSRDDQPVRSPSPPGPEPAAISQSPRSERLRTRPTPRGNHPRGRKPCHQGTRG